MRSSVFTQGEEVSTSFTDAVSQVLSEQSVLTEAHKCQGADCMVHIAGYGMVKHSQAVHEAKESHRLAGNAAESGLHGNAAHYHERAAMFHKAVANHDQNTKKGPGGHTYHISEAVEAQKPAVGSKVRVDGKVGTVKSHHATGDMSDVDFGHGDVNGIMHHRMEPVHESSKGPEAFPPGTEVATAAGMGQVIRTHQGDEINDPFYKYVVKLHHEPDMRIFGHHELQKISVTEGITPKPSDAGKDMVLGRVASKYKRAMALSRKHKDKEKKDKKWFDENLEQDTFEGKVDLTENDQTVHHKLHVISGSNEKGQNRLSTQNPHKHWLVHEWESRHAGGGSGTHYMRVHVPHPWNPEKSYHTVIAGSGGGEGYAPGHHVHIHDDGNGTTHFGRAKHSRDWKGNYHPVPGTGTHGVITHTAKNAEEMKQWPKGQHGLYALK